MNIFRATALSTAIAFALLGTAAPASAYPDKPVQLTVGFGPGGPSGIASRFIQRRFKPVMGQTLNVLNKPGAGGAKAWSQIRKDKKDGYELTLLNFPHTVLQPIARGKNAGYSYDDIQPVLYYTAVPQVIMVLPDSPIKSLEDLIEAMKKKPGKITFGGTGIGGANHSAFYRFNKAANVTGAYVPFKDAASVLAALKSGATDVAWGYTTQGVSDGDSMKMLAIASEERLPLFPELRTMTELGYPVVDMAWWAIGVPPGTSKEVRQQVSETFAKVVSDPQLLSDMKSGGYMPMVIKYPESEKFKKRIGDDYQAIGQALIKK